jgi:uncharacterized protein (DUF697 family)
MAKKKSKKGKVLGPFQLMTLLREARMGVGDTRPLAVGGARELVPVLARELRAGGDASAVVENRVDGAAALVWIGPPDEAELRKANRAGIPIVAVSEEDEVPYVLAEYVVHPEPGHGFPVEHIAKKLAQALEERGTALAARLPVLRGPLSDHLIESIARKNGLISAAVFIPGVDMPMLTINQARLLLRLAVIHGQTVDRERLPELAGVVGAGFVLRTAARELLDLIPFAGWAVKGAVAYTGTKAVGRGAQRYFEEKAS